MLHKEMEDALNKQVNAELWSAYLYRSMACDMDNKNFPGIANWFKVQASEEVTHAEKIMDFISSVDGKVRLEPIAEVRQEWKSPTDAFENTLVHEKEVTSLIEKLMDKAFELKDYPTINMLQWFIDEQVEEEETPRNLLAALKLIEGDKAAMYLFDKKLGKRNDD
ncbi:MAG: ferritin [Prevotellaceae bacterium]|jgi:ferritin|nr:ferritin [Prevotellaceae bacterium]